MSFLDNLENNLKALENREERDPEQVKRLREQREAEKSRALLIAPNVAELKNGAFTQQLLNECVVLGHKARTKVHITWLGDVLRLQAKENRLELVPTPAGIEARLFDGDQQVSSELVDFASPASELAAKLF